MKKGFYAILAVLIIASLLGGFLARERTITVKPRPLDVVTNDLSTRTDPDQKTPDVSDTGTAGDKLYILNTNSKKAHSPDCSGAATMNAGNRLEYVGTLAELAEMGYEPCGTCKPD